ncbi:MAG: hypothetical protein K8J08_18170 [Thermoanaerobaculia bacterium]|nr:hypothetical protein [Thermoanaerobaculia bacterium]
MTRLRLRSAAFALVALLGGCLVAEAIAFFATPAVTGRHRADLRVERQALTNRTVAGDAVAVGTQPQSTTPLRPNAYIGEEVIHPFLGFVLDPAVNRREDRRARGQLEVTANGFLRRPGETPEWSRKPFQIAVTGGSVAMLLSLEGDRTLARVVADGLGLTPEEIGIRSWALGGFKQPQQLMNLALRLTQGERVDALVNLDGFNEIYLPAVDNYPARVAEFYPRAWNQRLLGILDPGQQKILLLISGERQRRQRLARTFDQPIIRSSPSAQLLWWLLDQRRAHRLIQLDHDLRTVKAEEGGYQARGPFQRYPSNRDLQKASVAEWARASRQIHALCEAEGITYLHFLQPNQYVEGSKPLSAEELRLAATETSGIAPLVSTGYPLLIEAGEELAREGLPFQDLTLAFASIEETLYIDSCCHVSPRGSSILAELIGESLVQRLQSDSARWSGKVAH